MNINVKKFRRIAILLGLVMMLAVVCASCVNLDEVEEVNPRDTLSNDSAEVSDTSDEEISVPEGTTKPPVIDKVVYTSPQTVAISGSCEESAIIRVTGGLAPAETIAHGTYFIIKVDLETKDDILSITAQKGDDAESPAIKRTFGYDATAQARLDGNNVSVGVNSRLYFDKMADDAYAKNLYTESQITAIGKNVNDTVYNYYYNENRANGQPVELIYVLIPNVTTIYPEILPEKSAEYTIYDQVASALKNTRATVIDMKEVFQQKLATDKATVDSHGGLYRVTDSALTDFGGYLTYTEIMNVVKNNFPEAAPRGLDEFTKVEVDAKGGNLVGYRELNANLVSEKLFLLNPKFSLDYGTVGEGTANISKLHKYVDPTRGDYNYFTDYDLSDGENGIAERWLIDTEREGVNLPNAIIYRDYSSYSFSDILAERFQKCVLVGNNPDPNIDNYNLNFSELTTFAAPDRKVVDYIIVIVSEDNFDNAFKSSLPK